MVHRFWGVLSLLTALSMPTVNAQSLNMTEGVSEISRQVYGLHMTIFYICCVIAVGVFGVMLYSLVRHRKSQGARPANFHESTKVEIAWTVIPFLILVGMAVPATSTLIAMEDPSEADLTIQVTGSQWKWHYRYFDHDIEFFSLLSTPRDQIINAEAKGENYLLEVDKPLVIPANQKVRFLMTSDDVIHSWWVPAFAVKKDANPGFINEAWTKVDTPGTYRGQCAELCGKDHAYMPIVVEVLPEPEFDGWLMAQAQAAAEAEAQEQASLAQAMTMDEAMALGEQIYNGRCASCHQPNGMGLQGVFPAISGSPIATGDLNTHFDIIVNGKAGTAMQAFASQLSAKELAAVITYQRNAWQNRTGDLIQAADIAQFQQQGVSEPNDTEAQQSEAKAPASPFDEAMALGEQIYTGRCVACHQANGMGLPGVFPAISGSAIATGDLTAHIDVIVNGKPGTAMQAFANQLSNEELAAVITYQRNAWQNQTGDLVEAADIVDFQQQDAAEPSAGSKPEEQQSSFEAAMTLGEQTYKGRCSVCHKVNGMGVPGAFPAISGSPVATGDLAAHIDIIVNGKPGTAMQAFGRRLSQEELAAVITYQRNAWDNQTGELVTTDDVAQFMGQ